MTVDQKSTKEKTLTSAYLELHRFGQNGDYERAIKAANRILHLTPQDEKALHCKIVCLIQQSKFYEALQVIQKNLNIARHLYFEKAYCQYRQNQTQQALETVEQAEELDFRLKELKAQIYYRLERFEDAYEIYNDIIKNTQDEYSDERETNLGAVLVQLSTDGWKNDTVQLRNDTYELCFNSACLLIAQEQYVEAEKCLRKCEKLCKESLEEDGAGEDEIDVELALIRVQLAYVYQKQGRLKESQQLYTAALKLKLDDIALVAVASNNVVVINKDQNVFDSRKKMKAATNDALGHKLPARQRKYIALNHAILMYYTNQLDLCSKLCKSVEETWPDLALHARITNALCLARSSDTNKVVDLLSKYVPRSAEEKLYITLSIVHILLSQGEQAEACKVLEEMGEDSYKPGIVGALITLYLGMKKKDTALRVFEKTVEWYQKNKVKKGDLSNMWRQAADFHMRNGQPHIAANSLEELIQSNPNDKKALAQLAFAYSQFDKKKATQLVDKFPPFEKLPTQSDLDVLENSNWLALKKTGTKQESSPGTPATEKAIARKRSARKRKTKLPKNCDPNIPPDSERWLPKYERSGFRKKRDRRAKEVIKGSQGTASAQADQYDFSKVAEQENSPVSSVGPSPMQKNPKKGGQPQKKNKKRR